MTRRVKVVMAFINIGCLIVALLLPTSTTLFSLIPVIVSAASWVFSGELQRKVYNMCLILASASGTVCFVLGLLTSVEEQGINSGHYIFRFNDHVAYLAGKIADYRIIAVFFVHLSYIITFFWNVCDDKSGKRRITA